MDVLRGIVSLKPMTFSSKILRAENKKNKWVTDIIYIQYGGMTKYLSTIIDPFNNEIVDYKL